jgi:hypothetical protein
MKKEITKDGLEKFVFYSIDGCWYWIGGVQTKGYGWFRSRLAHRVSYSIYKGIDPGNLNVCHSCDNKLCVNPDHLWLGTTNENIQDKMKKGRYRGNHLWQMKHIST